MDTFGFIGEVLHEEWEAALAPGTWAHERQGCLSLV